MAVLNKEEFFSQLHTRMGTDTSEEGLVFLENMTDTYNDLERRANGDGIDWEKKCREIDEAWKKRYRHRFFTGGENNPNNPAAENNAEDYNPEDVRIDDLFK